MQFGKWLMASTISVVCSVSAQAQVITDVLDRKVDIDLPAERVVLGFYAEDYMAIGTEAAFDKVVGISRDTWEAWRPASWKLYTEYRPSLKDIPDVGEVESQTFSIEKVLSLKPSVVVLADWQYKGLGMDVDRLEDAGIPVVVVDYNAQTLERHLKSTEILGELTGQEARAKNIANEYEETIVSAQTRISDANLPKPRAYVEFGKKGPDQYSFTYGKNMWGAMVTAMGGDNIAAPYVEWWGPMNPEQVIASKPEVVFISGTESGAKGKAMVMGQGIDPKVSVERLKGFANRAGWSEMPAVKNERLHGIYQGASRSILDASMAQYIAKSLYPDLFKDANPQQAYLDFYKKYLPVTPTGTFAISITE
ncbi:ABC transporter substrate-binding protein [Marinomonas mediterranea]|jgi:ABC-type Fe3+-hydroxamate transport system, periplasmic component|uniref:ABC-type transporter, periplasmic subunit n=1 Tax=Marinomonas mediterranea (strain ATCC 700492 / JCM 21426 / NBRC 103028 / MMB-1) TaxID=717774 RepID=F2JVM5_MARM1|nr:ABC transporter substrate-binding protein [Marinomonas mediterranea]ADZ90569.1 ABC-type transporter, periplasmic subunit [Marinomonas mediterranea MMB-1]WCN08616.1 ABC transporter substrate-binding protein [Marinomonas mediterranea]WCN12670.1 ABC transporter substrate-binding protein [Marinomonas mediterranea]WCN16744.1 ABC transporter substrate-binding protein [Marinomonas mediterranea MMB-1]